MNVKIIETGKTENLRIIDSGSGVDWVQDLIGNTGALHDWQFTWSEEDSAYLASQDTFEWWAKYIADSQLTEAEAETLADKLGISTADVMERISQNAGDDYGMHRRSAIETMREMEAEYA